MQPVTTIRKSGAGLFLIWLAGGAAAALFLYVALANGLVSGNPLGRVYLLAAILTVAGTALIALVYNLSYIRFDTDGMTVVDYSALFTERQSQTLYRDIEDVQIFQPGILAAIFGWDTLKVETAGTLPNLKLTFVPDGKRWAAYLISQSRQARVPVSTS